MIDCSGFSNARVEKTKSLEVLEKTKKGKLDFRATNIRFDSLSKVFGLSRKLSYGLTLSRSFEMYICIYNFSYQLYISKPQSF